MAPWMDWNIELRRRDNPRTSQGPFVLPNQQLSYTLQGGSNDPGATIGAVSFTGSTPTTWTIISGDPNHNFAIGFSTSPALGQFVMGQSALGIPIGSAAIKISDGTGAGGGSGPPPQAGFYNVFVQASNTWGNSLINVGITIVGVPVVQSTSFSVNRPLVSGENVGRVNASGNPTAWAITAGNTPGNFLIDNTGLITITSTGAGGLSVGTFPLTVQAQNVSGTGTGTATVTITAFPVITPATFNAAFPFTSGQLVGQMSATNSPTSWAITVGNSAGDFAIDSSGNITITATGTAVNTAQTFNFTITATNANGTGLGTCAVNVSQSTQPAPVVNNQTITITLPLTSGQVIGTMTASNSPTSWQIISGNQLGSPAVTNATFTVQLPLISGQVIGTMLATNSPTSWTELSETQSITVINSAFTANAGASVGSSIGTMTTVAGNATAWTIISGNTNNEFAINNSGGLTVASALSTGTVTLTIQASNSIYSGQGTSTINIISTGTAPVVQNQTLSIALPKTAGASVGTATAINGPTSWSIISGNPNSSYAINNAGGLSIGTGILMPPAGTFPIVVQATNASGSGTGTITVVASMPPPAGYTATQLVAHDQFTGTVLNSSIWAPNLGNDQFGVFQDNGNLPNPFSAENSGGNQLEFYDPARLIVNNGLTIQATPDTTFSSLGYSYRSGCMRTTNHFVNNTTTDIQYIQILAQQPDCTTGAWPALWFNSQAAVVEMDIQDAGFTLAGHSANNTWVGHSFATGNSQIGPTDVGFSLAANYHIYGFEWILGTSLKWYVDGVLMGTSTANVPTNPSDLTIVLQIASNATSGFHTVTGSATPATLNYNIGEVQFYAAPPPTFANAETQTLANAISPSAPTSWLNKADTLITAMKTAGVWSTLDLFYNFAAPTAQAASLNWRNPTSAAQTLTTHGTVTFSANQYVQGDGSTGFLSNSFAMNSGLAVNGNASIGFFGLNDDQVNNASPVATSSGTSGSFISTVVGTGAISTVVSGVNTSGAGFSTSSLWGSSVGHWHSQQTSTTAISSYLDGKLLASGTMTNAVDNGTLQLLKSGSTFSNKQIAFAHVGQSLGSSSILGFSQGLYNFLTAVNVRPVSGMLGATNGPSNVAPYKRVALGNGNNLIVPETLSTTSLTGLIQGGGGGTGYLHCLIKYNDPNYGAVWRLEVRQGDTAPAFDATDMRIQLRTQISLNYPASNDICFAFLIEPGSGLGSSFCDINDYHDNTSGVNTGPTHGLTTSGTGLGVYVWIFPNETVITNLCSPQLIVPNQWYMMRTQWREGGTGFVNSWLGKITMINGVASISPANGTALQIVSYTGAVGNSASPTGNWQQMALYRDPANNTMTGIWYANFEFDSSGTFPFASRLTSPLPVPPINQ